MTTKPFCPNHNPNYFAVMILNENRADGEFIRNADEEETITEFWPGADFTAYHNDKHAVYCSECWQEVSWREVEALSATAQDYEESLRREFEQLTADSIARGEIEYVEIRARFAREMRQASA